MSAWLMPDGNCATWACSTLRHAAAVAAAAGGWRHGRAHSIHPRVAHFASSSIGILSGARPGPAALPARGAIRPTAPHAPFHLLDACIRF